jgi:succinate dehydrogenase (ubiquinone) membrane anchor subunit
VPFFFLILIFKIAVSQSNEIAAHKPDRLHGSYHWDIERAASLALVPIIASQLTFGASPVTDVLLGVVLPLHLHIGKILLSVI